MILSVCNALRTIASDEFKLIGPTGALIEALENNINVIQICDNEVFDQLISKNEIF